MPRLVYLRLEDNQIETMDLTGADLSSLGGFSIEGNPLTDVLLADATLNQSSLAALMDGGDSDCIGIAEMPGVLTLDMSGIDFTDIPFPWRMRTMDDLEKLLLARSTNLDGTEVVTLTDELDSLNWLDVTGLWNTFDSGSQDSLNLWDSIDGNTLAIAVAGDANADGIINSADLAIWQQNYDPVVANPGNAWSTGDWDGNGVVNGADLALWQINHDLAGSGFAGDPVPELGTIALLGTGLIGTLGYARRRRIGRLVLPSSAVGSLRVTHRTLPPLTSLVNGSDRQVGDCR